MFTLYETRFETDSVKKDKKDKKGQRIEMNFGSWLIQKTTKLFFRIQMMNVYFVRNPFWDIKIEKGQKGQKRTTRLDELWKLFDAKYSLVILLDTNNECLLCNGHELREF